MQLERVGFRCGDLQGLGLLDYHSQSKETQFDKLVKIFDGLPKRQIVSYQLETRTVQARLATRE